MSSGKFRLGILETGKVPAELAKDHGAYPELFAKSFAVAAPDIETVVYSVIDGVFPPSPAACDGWLITGSKFGVYDPEPWIPPLMAFIRAAYAAGAPMIGVCFGHQIMAEALGGKVIKSPKGWGLGVHRYERARQPGWDGFAGAGPLTLHAVHQDQVVEKPAEAVLLARSEFCEIAALAYGDPAAPRAISVQAHPEFNAAYTGGLIELRRRSGVSPEVVDRAASSLGAAVDNEATFSWFSTRLRRAMASG